MNARDNAEKLYEYMVIKFIETIERYSKKTKIMVTLVVDLLAYIQIIETMNRIAIIAYAMYAPGVTKGFPKS